MLDWIAPTACRASTALRALAAHTPAREMAAAAPPRGASPAVVAALDSIFGCVLRAQSGADAAAGRRPRSEAALTREAPNSPGLRRAILAGVGRRAALLCVEAMGGGEIAARTPADAHRCETLRGVLFSPQ